MLRKLHNLIITLGISSILIAGGCATSTKTNTARTASEQILLSSAIDRSLSNVHFNHVAEKSVFVDDKYLDSVDKGYLIGSVRHKVLNAGGRLVAEAAKADIVLEVRSGGVGTDMEESFVGIPSLGLPGLPVELPEVKLISKDTQKGTAKIGIVAYNPATGESVGLGGESTALSDNENLYVLGVGPFKSGAVKEQMDSAIGSDTGVNSFANALGVEAPHKRRVRPVSLVDANKFPQPQKIAKDVQVAPLPAIPVGHKKPAADQN